MTDRIAKIILRGDIAGLKSSMAAASKSVNDVATRMTAASKEGDKYRQNLSAVGDTAGRLGLVAAAGIGVAIKKYADFDQAVSDIAATGDDARGSLEALRQAALDAGARTKFSATEAANAVENLAKAGISAKDILSGGLDGALDLAAAGNLEVADAAEIAAVAMKQFKLSGDQATHVADLLAAGAGKAVGDVSDLASALAQSGLVANQTGLSIEETTGALSAFADVGLLGSDAGTSLKTMLQSLTPSSDAARAAIEKYNLSAYDAQGNFIGLAEFAGKLRAGLSGLTDEQRNATLKTIYGSDAIRAAGELYNQGESGIRNYIAAVDDQGYAAEVAGIKMDNLKGDVETLGGALETAFIGTGEGANGPIREMVQGLTSLVDIYNEMPGPIKNGALGVLGLTAALGGSVFVASKAISGYSNLRENLAGVGASFDSANKKAIALRGGAGIAGLALAGLSGPAHEASESLGTLTDIAATTAMGFAVGGPWGAAAGFAIGTFSALTGGSAETDAALADLTATLDAQTGAITKNTAQWVAKALSEDGAAGSLKSLGISLTDATDAALGNEAAMKRVNKATEDGGLQGAAARAGIEAMRDSIKGGAEANVAATEAVEGSTEATAAFGESADAAAEEVTSLSDALDGLLDPLLTQDQAMVEWKRSIQSLTKDLLENGGGLDSNTKAGQDNRDAIRDRVQALKDSAQADLEATGNQDKFASKLQRGAKQILEAGRAANISEKEMRGYLKQLGLTPSQIKTLIEAQDEASPTVDSVQDKLNNLSGTYRAIINVAQTGANLGNLLGQLREARKGGGAFTGLRIPDGYVAGGRPGFSGRVPGTPPSDPTRDNVLAMTARGNPLMVRSREWIINEKASDRNDKWLALINGGLNLDDVIPGFASGGRASALEIKSQQRTIRDIERSLRETEVVGKGKKKRRRKVLRGLDAQIARLELAEAREELRDLKTGAAAKREAKESAAEQTQQNITSAKSDFASNFSIGGLSSTSSVSRRLDTLIADASLFTTLLSDLKKKGASPWLLAQLVNEGPTKGAIRLAKQYSTDSAALAAINGKATQIDQLTSQYGGMVGNPKFSSSAAWNPGISNSSTKEININAVDPAAFFGEIRRVVRHELSASAAGANV